MVSLKEPIRNYDRDLGSLIDVSIDGMERGRDYDYTATVDPETDELIYKFQLLQNQTPETLKNKNV